MEIGFREWLIVGAIIVILLIVIDGWRRMRAQSNSLKIDIDDKLADLGEDTYNPELPLGTARVFKPQDGENSEQPAPSKQAPLGQSKVEKAQQVHKDSSEQVSAYEEDPLMASAVSTEPAPTASQPIINSEPIIPESIASQPVLSEIVDQSPTEAFDEEIVSRPRVASPKNLPKQSQENIALNTPNVAVNSDTNSSQVNNDIGFSALDTHSSDEQVLTEALSEEIPEAAVEEKKEIEIAEPVNAIDSFTVPDILKKQPVVDIDTHPQNKAKAEQFSSSVSDQHLPVVESKNDSENKPDIDGVQSAEQIVSELTAQLDTDLNTNLAAATDNTDSIVNNLLNTRALSKQEVPNEIEQQQAQDQDVEVSKYNNDEIPTESVLRRQEAVEAQAPSRSQMNLVPDKFEALLAEREKDGFLIQPADLDPQEATSSFTENNAQSHSSDEQLSQNTQIEDHDYHTDEDHLDDDESAHNLIPNPFQRETVDTTDFANNEELQQGDQTVEIEVNNEQASLDPQSEIEELKARLKALAPDEYEALQEASPTSQAALDSESSDVEQSIDNPIGQRSENFDQIIAELDQQIEDQAFVKQAIDNQQLDQLSQALTQVTSEVTTVIDDDVNLEDIDDSISHLSEVDSLDESLLTSTAVEDTEVDSIDNQTVDPLMDGFKDEGNANDLMAQFEHDLQLDQQAVSNELDRPISEILRTQKTQTEQSTSYKADEPEEDALLSQTNENALSESLLLGENFDDQDDGDFNSQKFEQKSHQQEDGIDHTNDLGFSAFEQDYVEPIASTPVNNHNSDDPLMAGFDEPEDSHFEDGHIENSRYEETEHSDEEDLSAQKSLFNENELEAVSAAAKASKSIKKPRKAIANVDDPNVVLIVTVVAKDQYLNGAALRRVVEACGMEFGDMAVFHRFEDGADQGAVQFSMANAINPGIFDIENMDDTATPGVSFFMSMDEPLDPKNALECMMATAETVATHLNGDLLDDDRSVLRPQTKEHYRERVRIHEMNKLRQRAL